MIKFYTGRIILLGLCFGLHVVPVFSQQKAFPTAEGAGSFVTGGRGTATTPTTVFEVTNLSDNGLPGSLRYAINTTATYRTIVFRVSGTIRLTSRLDVKANTTIAGQTAPGYGICLADRPVNITGDNIIIRYIRCRLGDRYQNLGMVNGSGDDDAISDNGHSHKNIIVDHVTASWSNDESLTFYGGDSLTIQYCMISEPLNYSYHFETGDADFEHHGYGGIWGGRKASFHHNLLAHCQGRVPRFNGSRGFAVNTENADFRNNVLYNWGAYNTNGGEGGNYNIVNNYYKYGPSTATGSSSGVTIRYEVINPYKQTTPVLPYGKYFLDGNYVDGSPAYTARNWLGAAMSGGTYADTATAQVLVPFALPIVTTQFATDAYTTVLKAAGCSLPLRDTLDTRIVNDVMNRTGKIIDVQGGYPHGTPFTTSQTAWPVIDSLPAPADADHDGMPDEWETQRGLNPANAADRNGYNANGYSNIENYLNGDSIVAAGTIGNCMSARSVTSANTGSWIDLKDTTYSRIISTDTTNVVAAVLDNGNYGSFKASYFVSPAIRYGFGNKPYLNRNITIEAVNPAAITQPVTIRLYFTQAEFNALKAADNTIGSITDLRIIKVSGNTCTPVINGGGTVITPTATGSYGTFGNGYYLEFTTTTFSTFFMASAAAAPVLPLHLISFDASFDGRQVPIKWVTTNEINTKEFMVERSADGQHFASIGSVQASGHSDKNNYGFADLSPLPGVNYYRLKMMDKNGNYSYSRTVLISTKLPEGFAMYPNPAADVIIVSHPQVVAGAALELLSIKGEKINTYPIAVGALQTTIYISELANGSYLLVYKNNGKKLVTRFIKK